MRLHTRRKKIYRIGCKATLKQQRESEGMRWDGWYGWIAMRSTMYIRTLHNESLEKMSCGCGACNGSCLFFFLLRCCLSFSAPLQERTDPVLSRPSHCLFSCFPYMYCSSSHMLDKKGNQTNKGRNTTMDTLTKDSEKGVRERAG